MRWCASPHFGDERLQIDPLQRLDFRAAFQIYKGIGGPVYLYLKKWPLQADIKIYNVSELIFWNALAKNALLTVMSTHLSN